VERKWESCVVAKVLTDRATMDNNFISIMTRAWNMGPKGKITPTARNTYLVEFDTVQDMFTVLEMGVWTYRMETIVIRQAFSPDCLAPDYVKDGSLGTNTPCATKNFHGREANVDDAVGGRTDIGDTRILLKRGEISQSQSKACNI
jgi:Domain of unknown function (DUF4283)